MRHKARQGRRPAASSGPPAWLVFLVGAALVFGLFYLWQGLQNFIRTGGQGVAEATQRAQVVSSATAVRVTRMESGSQVTPRPSNTPIPECKDFVVNVPNAIVRDAPASSGAIVTSINEGEVVCVLEHLADSEWYVIDRTPGTRRLDLAYMHETVIRAVNPTLTPSITPTPLPTVTPMPSPTRTLTPTPAPTQRPTATRDLDITLTPTPTPTITPSPTLFRQSA
jgi:hypothetical protein